MSTKLTNGRGVPAVYPWEKWLQKGRRSVLVRGKHFHCRTHSLLIYLYIVAKRKGWRINVRQLGEDKIALTAVERL